MCGVKVGRVFTGRCTSQKQAGQMGGGCLVDTGWMGKCFLNAFSLHEVESVKRFLAFRGVGTWVRIYSVMKP